MATVSLPLFVLGEVTATVDYDDATLKLLAVTVVNPTARAVTVQVGGHAYTVGAGTSTKKLPRNTYSLTVEADGTLSLSHATRGG